jgi:hypothetical protein
MNRRDLEKHLRNCGCEFLHHGANHDIWWNPLTNTKSPVPRHTNVRRGTVRSVCRLLRIPKPTGL